MAQTPRRSSYVMTRRQWLQSSALAAFSLPAATHAVEHLRFGVASDPHYADSAPRGSRHYRESLAKMAECIDSMNELAPAFLVELGDFKDEDPQPVEANTLRYLGEIEDVFTRFRGPRYHVLGNHDLDSISKEQFLSLTENTGIDPTRTYYSFDRGGVHFVVLDACFRGDGSPYNHGNFDWTDANIPPHELDWLRKDLAGAPGPAIVFTHQLLDGEGAVYINNAAEVRAILERAGRVAAVFQGHHHAGQYNQINGIHYVTHKAMVEGSGAENNAYSIVEVRPTGLDITGYRRADSRVLR